MFWMFGMFWVSAQKPVAEEEPQVGRGHLRRGEFTGHGGVLCLTVGGVFKGFGEGI